MMFLLCLTNQFTNSMNQTMYNITGLVHVLEFKNKSFDYNIVPNKLGICIETFVIIPT